MRTSGRIAFAASHWRWVGCLLRQRLGCGQVSLRHGANACDEICNIRSATAITDRIRSPHRHHRAERNPQSPSGNIVPAIERVTQRNAETSHRHVERTARRRRLTAIQRDTAAELTRLLKLAEADVLARLAATPSEFDAFVLPALQRSIRQAMAEFSTRGATTLNAGAGGSWQAGLDLVEKPLEAGLALGGGPSIRLSGVLPAVDTRVLSALRSFMTDRIADIGVTVANRINSELGLAAIGAQTPSQAAGKIAGILETGGRTRALTIVRTELGRAFSVAGQARFEQAAEVLPGLKKQWRRSGKLHSRPDHDIADGQTQAVMDPFLVGGERLMFPRDPAASAKQTINCGCTSLPLMESWEVRLPGGQPFSPEELAASPAKRLISSAVGRLGH